MNNFFFALFSLTSTIVDTTYASRLGEPAALLENASSRSVSNGSANNSTSSINRSLKRCNYQSVSNDIIDWLLDEQGFTCDISINNKYSYTYDCMFIDGSGGYTEHVVYETYDEDQNVEGGIPNSFLVELDSSSEISMVILEDDPCNALELSQQAYWDQLNPPEIIIDETCDYEEVHHQVIDLMHGFFYGSECCYEDADSDPAFVKYICDAPYGYAEYRAKVSHSSLFGGSSSSSPTPYDIFLGESSTNYEAPQEFIAENPCSAPEIVWEFIIDYSHRTSYIDDTYVVEYDSYTYDEAIDYFDGAGEWYNVDISTDEPIDIVLEEPLP
jgi:hypothetical protein